MVRQLMMHSNVTAGIPISRGSFVFSQALVKVSASFTYVERMVVEAFDVINFSLSVGGLSLS